MKYLPLLHLVTITLFVASHPLAAQEASATAETNPASVPKSRMSGKDTSERHLRYVEQARQGDVDVLFLGDSLTARWMGKNNNWPTYFGEYRTANFGISGDETGHVLWRIQNGEADNIQPKLTVLLIGCNNLPTPSTAEQIAGGIQTVIAEIERRLPTTKLLVFGIFPREEKPEAPLRLKAAEVNTFLAAACANDPRVIYRDIKDRLLNEDGSFKRELTSDFVHLTPAGYAVWAEEIKPVLEAHVPKAPAPTANLP